MAEVRRSGGTVGGAVDAPLTAIAGGLVELLGRGAEFLDVSRRKWTSTSPIPSVNR